MFILFLGNGSNNTGGGTGEDSGSQRREGTGNQAGGSSDASTPSFSSPNHHDKTDQVATDQQVRVNLMGGGGNGRISTIHSKSIDVDHLNKALRRVLETNFKSG